jgi:hypothetical protein
MFNLPNPGSNPANPFYYRTHEEQRRELEEAVTVELDFKSDAEGKKAGGKMVRKGVYKMTFKNNAEMNKFMDTHADKLNEGTAEYRAMMKRYKGSDMEKVFKILDKEGFRMGEQSDTLVRNMLKKHRGNVKKAADQIMKDNPGMFDVNRMMMDHVEIDEENVYKRPARVSALGGQKFHAIVDSKGNIVSAGLSEKEAKERKTFGQKVRELPGAKVGQLVKEDIEQVDEDINESIMDKVDKMMDKAHRKMDRLARRYANYRDSLPRNKAKIDREHKERMERIRKNFDNMVAELDRVYAHVDEEVQLDEMSAKQHYNKMVAQGKVGRGGRLVTPIDRKRFPNREKEGLEGPFRSRKSGQVYYYDKKAGKYYDPLSDMFLQVKDVMENTATYDINEYLAEESD